MAKNGHNAKAIAHAKYSVWVKKSNCLKHAKNVSTNTLKLFYAKNGSKKQLIFENESILKMAKNGHNAKAIAHAKYSVWVKKSNCLKHAKNVSTNTLKLFYAKNGSKKTANIRKMRAF